MSCGGKSTSHTTSCGYTLSQGRSGACPPRGRVLRGERSGCDTKRLGLLAIDAAFVLLYRPLMDREFVIGGQLAAGSLEHIIIVRAGLRGREKAGSSTAGNMLKPWRDL